LKSKQVVLEISNLTLCDMNFSFGQAAGYFLEYISFILCFKFNAISVPMKQLVSLLRAFAQAALG